LNVGDDGGVDVAIPETMIKEVDREECGTAKLTAFEDDVAVVQIVEQLLLRPIHLELNALSLLILDEVKVVEAPLAIFERFFKAWVKLCQLGLPRRLCADRECASCAPSSDVSHSCIG